MTKNSIIVGLCVIFLSAVVSTPVEAQRDKRQEPRHDRNRTEQVQRGPQEKKVVMTKQELATLISAIVKATEENDAQEETIHPYSTCSQQRDIQITNKKDRDLLLLLLQYHNLNAMRSSAAAYAQPMTQAGQPINWGGQLCYPAGNNVVVTTGSSTSPHTQQSPDIANRIKALEEELVHLRATQQEALQRAPKAQQDNQVAQQLAALRNQINELEKASTQQPIYNYDQHQEIYQDRSRNNVQLSRSIFFKVNSDVINEEGLEAVKNVADFVINDPRAIVLVYGYASIDGPVAFNNSLAAKRAASVIKALQSAGVPAAAIKRYDNGVDTTPTKRTDARRVDMDVIY